MSDVGEEGIKQKRWKGHENELVKFGGRKDYEKSWEDSIIKGGQVLSIIGWRRHLSPREPSPQRKA